MRDQQPLCARGLEGLDGFIRSEMAARPALWIRLQQGRLADEEVGVPREPGEGVARAGVARVCEHRSV